jgi:hypothetical protein
MSLSKSTIEIPSPMTSSMKLACDNLPQHSISKVEHDAIQTSMLTALRRNVTEIQRLSTNDPLHEAEM